MRTKWLSASAVAVLTVLPLTAAPAAATATTPGTVISATTAPVPPEYAALATVKRIQYASTDVRGASITVTGLVFTPRTGKKNRTVAWAHGTTGLADRCAPSANRDVFWPEAQAAVIELLRRGWTVAATDYAGLGTPAAHPYLIGYSEARAVIDSVKAARNLDAALTTDYVVDGHSQGGQAALFSGELAPTYDGALVLRGVVALAPAAFLNDIAPLIPGSPGQGYLVMAMYGIQAVEPAFNPTAYLAPEARSRTAVLQRGCLYEILAAYENLTAAQLVPGGEVPGAVVDRLRKYGNPGQARPSAPILIVHGTADEAVPYFVAEQLKDMYGSSAELLTLEGEDHEGAVFESIPDVADWIAARFGR